MLYYAISYKGVEHPRILVSAGGRSWNQSPEDTKGQLYMLTYMFIYTHNPIWNSKTSTRKDNCTSPKRHILYLIKSVSRLLEAPQVPCFWGAIVWRVSYKRNNVHSLVVVLKHGLPGTQMSFESLLCPLIGVRVGANSSIFQSCFFLYKMIQSCRTPEKKFYMEYVQSTLLT